MKIKKINSFCFFVSIMMTILLVTACDITGGSDDDEGKALNIEFAMVKVPAGSFFLNKDGSNTDGPEAVKIQMNITKDFMMSATEVTQEVWTAVMTGSKNALTPSYHRGADLTRPVEYITWFDAIEFCNILSEKTGKEPVYTFNGKIQRFISGNQRGSIELVEFGVTEDVTKNGYRLPREMEWMWAAMGADAGNKGKVNETGYTKAFAGQTASNSVDDYVWYYSENPETSSRGITHGVGKKLPNELGLYDMTGNVSEWCWDRAPSWAASSSNPGGSNPRYYESGGENDYSGITSNEFGRISRGTTCGDKNITRAVSVRSSNNTYNRNVDVGFRIVCAAD